MIVLTKQMIRDILAFEKKGLSLDDLYRKLKKQVNYVDLDKNHVMAAVLDLQIESKIKYDLEVGTWKSLIRLL